MEEHDLIYIREGNWSIAQDGINYDLMPDDDICIITGHANAGVIDFCNGTYEGDNISSIAVNVFVKLQYGGKRLLYRRG
jgi:hypothetical protein